MKRSVRTAQSILELALSILLWPVVMIWLGYAKLTGNLGKVRKVSNARKPSDSGSSDDDDNDDDQGNRTPMSWY